MSRKAKIPNTPMIIEIDDSSDEDESTETSDPPIIISNTNSQQRKSVTILSNETIIPKQNDNATQKQASTSSTECKKTSNELDIPKRIVSRRKSVHHSIRSTENLSFECPTTTTTTRKRRESVDDISDEQNKKKHCWEDNQIDEAVDQNLADPEIDLMLKKIAYCRVFTNYLLRQYDMLAIDFKLYSNLDLLNLDLKMRVDTYSAIRKSRQRFREALEMNGQVQL